MASQVLTASHYADASCNLIPQTTQTFDSVRGSANRPYAAPGEPLELRVRPCDPGGPGFTAPAANYVVTVVFTPASGTKNVVVLATNCAAIGSCAGAASTTCVPVTVGNQLALVLHGPEPYLRLTFPDTDALLAPGGDALGFSGPAAIAVKDSTVAAQPAACELVSQNCLASTATTGLVACVDQFFANDGTCNTIYAPDTFVDFTALPPPNIFGADCFDTVPPCTPASSAPLRLTTDAAGNGLIPMDWRGILVQQNQIPVPRLLHGIVDVPALPLKIPGKSFVASYTPEGALLPPIFEPEFAIQAVSGALTLFGSADAPYTVLRLARRSDTFQQCTGGFNDGGPCNGAEDCPSACVGGSNAGARCVSNADCASDSCGAPGACGATVCSATSSNPDAPCNSDALCPGGECGPALFNVAGLATGGTGPVVVDRLASAGICQQSVLPPATQNMCTPMLACSGDGPCVQYALNAESPVPLDGLAQTTDVFGFAVNEGVDVQDRNGDGDTLDTVITLRDRSTGQVQPLGAPAGCGISGTPDGRAVVMVSEPPFSFPAVAVENDILAFFESESSENGCVENNDFDAVDAIVRVFRQGVGELPISPLPAADADPKINYAPLVVSNGRVFYRASEAAMAQRFTELESVATGGAQGTQISLEPAISADGRYVAFQSYAPNLVPGDTNGAHDIFVRDRQAAATERVSVGASGQANEGSISPAISADGRYVAFASLATNLIVPPILVEMQNIFVRDRQAAVTERVTIGIGSAEPDGASDAPSISADGRYVAFESDATNLVSNDTNGFRDVFVLDRQTSMIERVSVSTVGGEGNGNSSFASISADGRYVAFNSVATNLVSVDSNGAFNDVFIRDRQAGTTTLVSVSSSGVQGSGGDSARPSLSADGRWVAFRSGALNLVPNDANGKVDVFVRDLQAGTTELVSVSTGGVQGNDNSDHPSISADGRFIAFQSDATNLVLGDANGDADIFVHDRLTGVTERVSVDSAGGEANSVGMNSQGFIDCGISADGRSVVFDSNATNLVSGDANGVEDVFVRGLDPSDPLGVDAELFANGVLDDTVLQVFDTGSSTLQTLCPAEDVSVSSGSAAFLRPESAAGTTACPGGSLNGDADTDDNVVQYWPGSGPVQNLSRAATAVALASQCTGGANVDQVCSTDADCPSSTCAASWIGALVSESDQGNADLNGDHDSTDDVVEVHRVSDAPTTWKNVGQAADDLQLAGSLAVFITPEAAQGNEDLNGDGDHGDRVLQVYDAAAARLTNVGQAAEEFVVGTQPAGCASSPLIAFRTSEAAQGSSDLNGDGDTSDFVLQVYAKGLGLINTHQAVTPCRLEACDPRLPYRVLGNQVKFLTFEADQGRDLNGDGDTTDLILQVFDACTGTLTVIGTVDPNPPPGTTVDPLNPSTDGGGVVHTQSGQCVLGMQTLLVPASCTVDTDCPSGATCQSATLAAAPNAAPTHDTAIIARGAVTARIPRGRSSIKTSLRVGVRNADVGEKPGHTVRLVATDGTCPAGTVSGLPILGGTKLAPTDTVLVAGGKSRVATVPLTINASAFTSLNFRSPTRCTLQLVASAVVAGNVDPTPANNVLPVELNVIDRNDADPGIPHQSVLYSTGAVVATLRKGLASKVVNVRVTVGNADIAPQDFGNLITVTTSDGTCPAGTVGAARMNRTPLNSVAVDGGQLRRGYFPVTIDRTKFTTANGFSPARCVAQVTATGPGGDTDLSNNTSNLVLDVIDKNDF